MIPGRWIAILFLLVPLASIAGASCSRAQSAVDDALSEAQAFVAAQNFTGAIETLTAVREKTAGADRARINNALGWSYLSSRESKNAETFLKEAHEIARPLNDRALKTKIANNLGILYFTQGDLEKAKPYFEASATRGSGLADKYLGMISEQSRNNRVNEEIRTGILYRQTGEFAAAIGAYDKALAIAAADVRALEYRGYANFRLKRYDDAEKDLLKAYALDPDGLTIIVNLLKVYCAKDDAAKLTKLRQDARAIIAKNAEAFRGDTELRRTCGGRMAELVP